MTIEVGHYTKKANKRITVRVIYVDETRVAFKKSPFDCQTKISTCTIDCFIKAYKVKALEGASRFFKDNQHLLL